jgi:chromosome segregation ATPase
MENETISEDRFKGEMTRLMGVVIQKIDGLENRFIGLENRFDCLEEKVDKNGKKLDILVGQFTDVTSKVIFNDKRLTKVEGDVAELQSNIH